MAVKKDRVLWADDEIDLLKPHACIVGGILIARKR